MHYIRHKELGRGWVVGYVEQCMMVRFDSGTKFIDTKTLQVASATPQVRVRVRTEEQPNKVRLENSFPSDEAPPSWAHPYWSRYRFQKPNTAYWNRVR